MSEYVETEAEARDAMRRANEKDLENLRAILEQKQGKDETRSSS